MKVGDVVNYKGQGPYHDARIRAADGVIMSTQGRKWVKVGWSNNLITKEHVKDLEVISEGR